MQIELIEKRKNIDLKLINKVNNQLKLNNTLKENKRLIHVITRSVSVN